MNKRSTLGGYIQKVREAVKTARKVISTIKKHSSIAIQNSPEPLKARLRLAYRIPLGAMHLLSFVRLMLAVKANKKYALKDPLKKQQKFAHKANAVLGIKVKFNHHAKANPTNKSVLFTPNHISELDIPVVGTGLHARFAGKSDLIDIPLFPEIVKLTKLILVKRYPHFNDEVRGGIIQSLNEGHDVVVFPEGTTNWKHEVRTFRPALLKSLFGKKAIDANGEDITLAKETVVQPIAIKVPKEVHDDYCLKAGELQSMFNLMVRKETAIEVSVLPTLDPKDFSSAKELARAAQESIANVVNPGQEKYTPLWWKNWDGHEFR